MKNCCAASCPNGIQIPLRRSATVKTSWTKTWSDFKSPLRVVAQFLWRSRENKAKKCSELKEKLEECQLLLARRDAELEQQREEMRQWQQRARRLETEKRIAEQSARPLPPDPPVGKHGYGARMVSLAVNLAQGVGLRGAHRALKIFFAWLKVEQDIPHATAIRTWMLRVGVAALKEPVERCDDWVWMADHSNQIGPEKALVVLAVRASKMPAPGKTLKHEDIRVLTVRPGTAWTREDMATVYTDLAEQHGAPRAVLTDGAVELREGADCLKSKRADAIVLPDFKHKGANFLKARLGKDERFAEFNTLLGKTRSAIQQTELAHLTPPSPKQKARFMNLKATLDWAAVVLWLLNNPQAKARQLLTAERLEEKLGWLRSFADELAVWRECQQVVSRGVTFINEQGLFRGASRQLRRALFAKLKHSASRRLANQLVKFVAAAECQLNAGERLPMSTEILESTFALYKQLERQHSKGGFTSLLAGFAALLKKSTPESIKQAFANAKVKDVKKWVKENLGATLTTKRRTTYNEFKQSTRVATKLAAAA